jgi:hypothetical protein
LIETGATSDYSQASLQPGNELSITPVNRLNKWKKNSSLSIGVLAIP